MELGGYTGKNLIIDVSNRSFKTIDWLEQKNDWLKLIGGRGFGAKIMWETTDAKTNPLSPEGIITLNTGPLTGLPVPGAGRISMCAISPQTGIWADSSIGGNAGAEIKQCGYDSIIIKGKSEKPVYLYLHDEDVDFENAEHLWGKGSFETETIIKEELNNDPSVLTIGPAGEKRVLFACITTDYGRQAGRTGMGTILGSKSVKAVAINGTKDVPVADLNKIIEITEEATEYMIKSDPERYNIFTRHGTTMALDWAQEVACLPTRNFQENVFEESENINADSMEQKIKVGDRGCYCCPLACGKLTKTKVNGEQVYVEGPEYETLALLGSNLGLGNIEDIAAANYLCDHYGIDTISTGVVIGFAIECAQRGKISLDGLKPEWGNTETIFSLIEKIAYRKGLGNILADGVKKAAEAFGNGCQSMAMHVKGLEQSGYETRSTPGMSLAYGTSDMGAHHSRSTIVGWETRTDRLGVTREKVEMQIYLQHQRSLFDALGTCRFQYCEAKLPPEEFYPRYYVAATGLNMNQEGLLLGAERIFNLTRMINIRRGVSRKDDYPPARVFDEALPSGPYKGKKMSREEYDKLLDMYYEIRGWNHNGTPTREKLRELNLEIE
ncbi:MAG: aldehyde ferredoxin oxidoreductase family protein [Candidatus Jordarchaeum sp.]|uniref:aldehyde ferredoxin oxidoreductase family protein n=1 Tax=Candidatus Jordarchaeum sp. TaxID=2823881 RepID=UPI00404B4228